MILQIIFGTLSFLLSLWGVMTLFLGIISFFLFPVIGLATPLKGFSRFFLKLAAFPIKRAAIVVSEHNDVLFKQMSFDGLGVETITIDGQEKQFEDPDSALHYWLNFKFALADEEHGVIFDPRHAAVGKRKKELDDRGESEFLATEKEWSDFGVAKWMPAVFSLPQKFELVDLSHVQELIDGGERAEYGERVEEIYKLSRDPFGSSTPAAKFLYPIIAFAVTFGGIWVLSSQLGGPSSSVSFGGFLGLLLAGIRPPADLDYKRLAAVIGLLLIPLGAFTGLFVVFNPIIAVAATVVWLLGMSLMPLLTVLVQPSNILSGALSKLYFKLGFLGFKKPVLTWTPQKYVVKEYSEMDTTADIEWYTLFGSIVGFSYQPGSESWDAEYISHERLEAEIEPKRNMLADGGSRDSNLPPKYVRSDEFTRDMYGGYLPKRVSDSMYYIRSGIAMHRFANSAIGRKSLRKLLEAKQVHGEADDGLSDSVVFKTTLVSGLLGAVAGIGIFLLPAFL